MWELLQKINNYISLKRELPAVAAVVNIPIINLETKEIKFKDVIDDIKVGPIQLSLFTKKIDMSPEVIGRLKVLSKLGSKVAKVLLWSNFVGISPESFIDDHANYIGLSETDQNMISFLPKEKTKPDVKVWEKKNRTVIKSGKMIRKLISEHALKFYDITDQDVEFFGNNWSKMNLDKDEQFEVVSGNNIRLAYLKDNYHEHAPGSPLYNSCMSDGYKQAFLDIYARNPTNVSLVVLKKNGKIAARAILWTFKDILTQKEVKVVDRVYYIKDSYITLYKMWAIQRGCWFMEGGKFLNPHTLRIEHKVWTFDIPNINFDYYPYIDTFFYLDLKNKKISNDSFPGSRVSRSTSGHI